jgi:hypothetical protein
LVAGLALMYFSYRRYRYGEHYEFLRRFASPGGPAAGGEMPEIFRQVGDVVNKLEKFR